MARLVGRMVTMFLLIMVPISQEFNVPLISVAFVLARRPGRAQDPDDDLLLHLVECTFGSLRKFSL